MILAIISWGNFSKIGEEWLAPTRYIKRTRLIMGLHPYLEPSLAVQIRRQWS